jgi:hypothetical protein
MLVKLLFDWLTPLLSKDNVQAHEDLNEINNMLAYEAMCDEALASLMLSHGHPEPSVEPTPKWEIILIEEPKSSTNQVPCSYNTESKLWGSTNGSD